MRDLLKEKAKKYLAQGKAYAFSQLSREAAVRGIGGKELDQLIDEAAQELKNKK